MDPKVLCVVGSSPNFIKILVLGERDVQNTMIQATSHRFTAIPPILVQASIARGLVRDQRLQIASSVADVIRFLFRQLKSRLFSRRLPTHRNTCRNHRTPPRCVWGHSSPHRLLRLPASLSRRREATAAVLVSAAVVVVGLRRGLVFSAAVVKPVGSGVLLPVVASPSGRLRTVSVPAAGGEGIFLWCGSPRKTGPTISGPILAILLLVPPSTRTPAPTVRLGLLWRNVVAPPARVPVLASTPVPLQFANSLTGLVSRRGHVSLPIADVTVMVVPRGSVVPLLVGRLVVMARGLRVWLVLRTNVPFALDRVFAGTVAWRENIPVRCTDSWIPRHVVAPCHPRRFQLPEG